MDAGSAANANAGWLLSTPLTASRWPEVVEPGLMRQVTRLSEMLRQIWLIISKKKKRLSTLVSKQHKL